MRSTAEQTPELRRPRYHLTAEAGWVNDPHGLVWYEGRYHLYFQYVPGQTVWGPSCHWGHAIGPDLAHWERRGAALVPTDERGCWTGAAAQLTPGAPPVIVYTSVGDPDWGHGRITMAVGEDPDLHTWTRPTDARLIDGPPAGSGVHNYRDPFLWQSPDGVWKMLVGGGLPGLGGVALQYSRMKDRTWTYDGVLCCRGEGEQDGWTGQVWECPQLFALGDSWVLLFGVWEDEAPQYVCAAVGDYDGRTFTPRRSARLTHGDAAYATTSFLDTRGRRCLMHWLREKPGYLPAASAWAGALSVAQVVTLGDDDRLVVEPHPDVDTLRMADRSLPGRPVLQNGQRLDLDLPGLAADLLLELRDIASASMARLTLTAAGEELATLTLRLDAGEAQFSQPGHGHQRLPLPMTHGSVRLRLLLDGDVLEVFSGQDVGAWRLSVRPGKVQLSLSVEGGSLRVDRMTAHQMAASVR